MRPALCLALSLGSLLAQGPPPGKTRDQIPEAHRWRIEDLYPSAEAWRGDFTRAEQGLRALEGALADGTGSAQAMAAMLGRFQELSLRIARLESYAALQGMTADRAPLFREMQGAVAPLAIGLAQAASRRDAALRTLGRTGIEARMAEVPALGAYRAWFDEALRGAAHGLSEEGEQVLAEAARFSGGARDAAMTLQNLELPPRMLNRGDGSRAPLDGPTYWKLVASKDPAERRAAGEAMVSDLKPLEHTFAALMDTCVKRDVFEARVRKHPDAFAAECFPHGFDPAVARGLVKAVRAHLGPYHRYLQLKQRILGLPGAHAHDLQQPLFPDTRLRFDYEEARRTFLASAQVLGKDYGAWAQRAFEDRWVDAFGHEGKVGAGSLTAVPGVHPYALLDYRGSFFDAITLAHEVGHGLHYHLSDLRQPFAAATPAYLLTEVPSTLHEILWVRQLLQSTSDLPRKRALLAEFLDRLSVLLVFDAQVAELQFAMHAHVEQGGTLTAAWLNETQLAILRAYSGHDQGILKVADHEQSTWNYPVAFFDTWRGYKLVLATVASLALADQLEREGPGAARRVVDFIQAGSSRPPLELLRAAGVDLADPTCVAQAMGAFGSLVGELEKLADAGTAVASAPLNPAGSGGAGPSNGCPR